MNLGQIRSLVREYLNEPVAALWTDANLNLHINTAVRKSTDMIKNLSRNHFTTRATFQTVSGQEYYQLPANCKDIKIVTIVSTDGVEIPIFHATWPNPFKWTDPAIGPGVGVFAPGDLVQTVWIVGASIRLVPIPGAAFTMRLYFEARVNDLTADSDVPTFDEDYHDMAAKWAAMEARVKNQQSSADIAAL